MTVPKHAVRRQQRIRYRLLFGLEPTDIPNDWFVFSPTIVFEPDDVPFQVPVKVRFPFTATLEGWTLVLMRESENPEKKKETVLTIDTDDRRVIRYHSHCSFDLNKRLLLLEHFCKYRWCGYKKEDASSAEKRLACLLYARLDSSGNSYEFALYLTDDCDDIFQEAEKLAEDISGMSLGLRDKEKIIIGTDGDLTIEIIGEGLQIDMYNGKNSVVIQLRDLFKRCEIHKRILFEGKCAHHGDGSKDSQLRICLSTSKRSEIMRATFNSKSRELQRCHSFRSLAAQESCSSNDSVYHTESANSSRNTTIRRQDVGDSSHPSKKASHVVEELESNRRDGEIISDGVIMAAGNFGCEGQDWITIGEKLLDRTRKQVLDLFSDSDGSRTNSQKTRCILTKWVDKKGTKAKVGQLRQVYVSLNKGGKFDETLEADSEDSVSRDMIIRLLPISCEERDWLTLGLSLLDLSDPQVRDLFPTSPETPKNSERVQKILTKWKEKDGPRATIRKLREAFHSIGKGGSFDDYLAQDCD